MSTSDRDNNRNVRTKSYRDLLEKLPEDVVEAAEFAFGLFVHDPESPALKNHPLNDNKKGRHRSGSRAVSVGYRYRAIYVEDGDTNVWYWIGSHEDYNNFAGGK